MPATVPPLRLSDRGRLDVLAAAVLDYLDERTAAEIADGGGSLYNLAAALEARRLESPDGFDYYLDADREVTRVLENAPPARRRLRALAEGWGRA